MAYKIKNKKPKRKINCYPVEKARIKEFITFMNDMEEEGGLVTSTDEWYNYKQKLKKELKK